MCIQLIVIVVLLPSCGDGCFKFYFSIVFFHILLPAKLTKVGNRCTRYWFFVLGRFWLKEHCYYNYTTDKRFSICFKQVISLIATWNVYYAVWNQKKDSVHVFHTINVEKWCWGLNVKNFDQFQFANGRL